MVKNVEIVFILWHSGSSFLDLRYILKVTTDSKKSFLEFPLSGYNENTLYVGFPN